jgi:glycerophosphoryl diester phosphodiesterase
MIVHHMAALDDARYPPNSLEGIRACLEAGAAFIEVDVLPLAADDYLLVHDPELEHETTGSGEVGEASVEQVRDLFLQISGEETPFRPPLLSDVVNLFQQHGGATRLQIDYKYVLPMRDDEPLRRFLRLIEPLGERVLVSSEADWHLRWLRRQALWLDLGFDIGFYLDYRPTKDDERQPPYTLGAYGYHDDHILARAPLLTATQYLAGRCDILLGAVPQVSTWYVNYRLLLRCLEDDFNMADWLHPHGVRLDAWTLDMGKVTDADILRLRDAGVDLFTTNTPLALQRLLQR